MLLFTVAFVFCSHIHLSFAPLFFFRCTSSDTLDVSVYIFVLFIFFLIVKQEN
jgi:hypothetical protein